MRTPSLSDVVNHALTLALGNCRVALPAEVVRYDAEKQLVDARPTLLDSYETEAGERKTTIFNIISNVPVVFPGSGPYSITWPIAVGDTVLLLFSDRCLETWLERGLKDLDSGDDRIHDINDAMAIPGLRPFSQPVAGAGTDAMLVGDANGAHLRIEPGGTGPADKRVACVGSATAGHSHTVMKGLIPLEIDGTPITIGSATDTIATGSPNLKVPGAA